MGITLTWYDEQKHIILWAYQGRWTADEFDRATEEASQLIDTVDYPVGVIVDFSHSTLMPPNIMMRFRQSAQQAIGHPNNTVRVIVGADYYLKIFLNTLFTLAPPAWYSYFASTREEAAALIYRLLEPQPATKV